MNILTYIDIVEVIIINVLYFFATMLYYQFVIHTLKNGIIMNVPVMSHKNPQFMYFLLLLMSKIASKLLH